MLVWHFRTCLIPPFLYNLIPSYSPFSSLYALTNSYYSLPPWMCSCCFQLQTVSSYFWNIIPPSSLSVLWGRGGNQLEEVIVKIKWSNIYEVPKKNLCVVYVLTYSVKGSYFYNLAFLPCQPLCLRLSCPGSWPFAIFLGFNLILLRSVLTLPVLKLSF